MALRRRYDIDLTDAQWIAIADLALDAKPGARPRAAPKCESVDAILYGSRAGHPWRLPRLPGPSRQSLLPISIGDCASIVTKAGARTVPMAPLLQLLDADGLIRLQASDFEAFETMSDRFVTFNLQRTTNQANKRYAVVPIVRPGCRDAAGREALPLLEPARARVRRCVRVRQFVPVGEVTNEEFSLSLPNVRTPEQLGAALVERYAPLHPQLTPKQLVARGCAVTTLEL